MICLVLRCVLDVATPFQASLFFTIRTGRFQKFLLVFFYKEQKKGKPVGSVQFPDDL
jgi:hypothetical protein